MLCAVSMGARCAAADKGAGAGAEKRRVSEGAPAGGPDVEALVEVAASQLLGMVARRPRVPAGMMNQSSGQKGGSAKTRGNDAAGVTAREKNGGTCERNDGGQKSSARGGEQHSDEPERQKAERQRRGGQRRSQFRQKRGKRKAEIEKAGDFVGVLAVGGEADLAGGDGFRRAESGEREKRRAPMSRRR